MAKTVKLVTAFIAFMILMTIHEGLHVITSMVYNEFGRFVVHPYGFEVVFKTPVELREGFKWFIISGTSNIVHSDPNSGMGDAALNRQIHRPSHTHKRNRLLVNPVSINL